MTDKRSAGVENYKTYVLEFWVIYFKYGETQELPLTAEQISTVWSEAKFGNLGRVLATLLGYPFSIPSYFFMKAAQSRARKN